MQSDFATLPDEARSTFGHLLDKLGEDPLPRPAGWRLLVLQYVRPEKSKGGILLAEQSRREDEWQGRIGLVLAVGRGCWSDVARYGPVPWAAVGSVVLWPKLDNASTRISHNGCTLAFLNDDSVVATHLDALKAMA